MRAGDRPQQPGDPIGEHREQRRFGDLGRHLVQRADQLTGCPQRDLPIGERAGDQRPVRQAPGQPELSLITTELGAQPAAGAAGAGQRVQLPAVDVTHRGKSDRSQPLPGHQHRTGPVQRAVPIELGRQLGQQAVHRHPQQGRAGKAGRGGISDRITSIDHVFDTTGDDGCVKSMCPVDSQFHFPQMPPSL